MKFANEPYVLGIPERIIIRAMRELGWVLLQAYRDEDPVRLRVRRINSVLPWHTVTIARDTRRRHIVDSVRVQLRLKGT